MKTIYTLWTALIFLSSPVSAQQQADLYQTGRVRFQLDPEYGKNTQWEKILSRYRMEKD